MNTLLLSISIALFVINGAESARIKNSVINRSLHAPPPKDTVLWENCIDFPVLGNSCLEIYTILPNLTLGMALSIGNTTYLNFHLIEGLA